MRKAFLWLKQHNPYYHDIEWIRSAEEAWREEDVQIGSVREEDLDLGRSLQIDRTAFLRWIQQGEDHHHAGEGGFPIAARTLDLFEGKADGNEQDPWNQIRAMAATTFDKAPLRAASSLEHVRLAVVVHVDGGVEPCVATRFDHRRDDRNTPHLGHGGVDRILAYVL